MVLDGTIYQVWYSEGMNKVHLNLYDGEVESQFITYDGKSESEIYLRLRNNSSCGVVHLVYFLFDKLAPNALR